jgi:FAD/FMN-containing dehydrogenase
MSENLMSWGRHPFKPQHGLKATWRAEVPANVMTLAQGDSTTLPYGNGRSYGDSCLAASGRVLHMRQLNRFISVDWQTGVLRAEAGVTLAEILQLAVPKGWFLSVTPGTKFVTLGGAIANDVHGKNHHLKGTFGNHLRAFCLSRSNEELKHCTPFENAELYRATIGGLGLTGVILWAEIQLSPIDSNEMDTFATRFSNLKEFFRLSDQLDSLNEYGVAWIDCVAKGEKLGRGVYFVGNHAPFGEFRESTGREWAMPFTPPVSLINNLSLRAFNEAYWRSHPREMSFSRSAYETFFFPLDRIANWNRMYGPKGFQQYQCVVPESNGEAAIEALLSVISNSGQGSFLAVLKRCGPIASPGLLSFPLAGVSLALDFPNNSRTANLFKALDIIVFEAGGRLYPAKDAHMDGHHFRAAYPAWEELESLRDPLLNSEFWKRVTS